MPGVTTRKPGPRAARIARASWGDATTPCAPASAASRASRVTVPSTPPAIPIASSAAASRLVRTVIARMRVGVPRAASAAASIMARPPAAWMVSSETPSPAAAATAPATVLGMSWNLRSRNTRWPSATSSRTTAGPPAVKSWLPTLNIPTSPARRPASARAAPASGTSSATMRRSRGDHPAAPCAGPPKSSVPTTSLMSASPWRWRYAVSPASIRS